MGLESAIIITPIVPDLIESFPLPTTITNKKWELCYNLRHAEPLSNVFLLAAGTCPYELCGQS
jgi:hypothetical protein